MLQEVVNLASDAGVVVLLVGGRRGDVRGKMFGANRSGRALLMPNVICVICTNPSAVRIMKQIEIEIMILVVRDQVICLF